MEERPLIRGTSLRKSYSYLLDKIDGAEFLSEPFRHIQIDGFFSQRDFDAIVCAGEIAIPNVVSDSGLLETLGSNGYQAIEFPGCVIDKQVYLEWHKHKAPAHGHNQSSCEGFGMAFRLARARTPAVEDLLAFLNGDLFRAVLAKKFDVDMSQTRFDVGIQKYLDGYEISPHPDIRVKALTFMANINPSVMAEINVHHTHLLRFRPEYKYVQAFWEGNPSRERCWVPWSWCESVKTQNGNNTFVAFAPSDNTLHAVKAKYDHLSYQRTQIYGNFWYLESKALKGPSWEKFELQA
jgi:hypothetical protein